MAGWRVLSAVLASGAIALGAPGVAPAADIEHLMAGQAAADYQAELELFGAYVGDWDATSEYFPGDGSRGTAHGSIHIGWILYGTALQDVWLADPDRAVPDGAAPNGATPRERPAAFGTTVRFYDRAAKVWRAVWVSPTANVLQTFTASRRGDDLVLEGTDPQGRPVRWTWSDLTADSFTYRSEISMDGGATWRVEDRVWAKRRK